MEINYLDDFVCDISCEEYYSEEEIYDECVRCLRDEL